MLSAVEGVSTSMQNGLFINSCFAHCQTERQDTWLANDSPVIGNRVCLIQLCCIQFNKICKVLFIVVSSGNSLFFLVNPLFFLVNPSGIDPIPLFYSVRWGCLQYMIRCENGAISSLKFMHPRPQQSDSHCNPSKKAPVTCLTPIITINFFYILVGLRLIILTVHLCFLLLN